MSRNKSAWRPVRINSPDFNRADQNCDEVLINKSSFRLCKYKSNLKQEGKWLLFSPMEKFLGRCSSPYPPTKWAEEIINKEMS